MSIIYKYIKNYPSVSLTVLTICLAPAAFFISSSMTSSPPSLEDYVAKHKGSQKVNAGQTLLAGKPRACGKHPSVLDPNLDDFAAAHPGYVILNSKNMAKVSDVVQLYIFYHECGHQFVGPDETAADCYSVQRGRREGWLTPEGMEEVCTFIKPTKGSNLHPPGPKRCELMKHCYNKANKEEGPQEE